MIQSGAGQPGVPAGLISSLRMHPTSANVTKTNFDSSIQRRRRLKQLELEEKLAKELRDQGWEIFSPTVVCDRVGVKGNKVFFIEFKKSGQELRPGQKTIAELAPEMYVVRYY